MYKMLVSNFYNTLLDNEDAISLSTMVEIDRIRKNNVLFVVTTDSTIKSVVDYNRDFPFVDYIIACSGAIIYDVVNKKVIFKKNIMSSLVKKIRNIYNDCEIVYYTLNGEYLIKRDDDFNEFFSNYKNDIYKMNLIFKTKKLRDSAYDEIGELGLKINVNKFDKDKKYMLEITRFEIDKYSGVFNICNKNKISTSEVVCIGCQYNDITMIENCGMGCCLSNAIKDVKKISKYKGSSNICNGVCKIIKKYFK